MASNFSLHDSMTTIGFPWYRNKTTNKSSFRENNLRSKRVPRILTRFVSTRIKELLFKIKSIRNIYESNKKSKWNKKGGTIVDQKKKKKKI